jgi:hypothetical protein
MGPRRTNLALLVVLVAALATGGLAFAAGTGWGRPVVVAHAVAGLAVLVLAPWKSPIVRRGLARRAGAGPWMSVTFGVLVLAAVATGVAHATGALADLGPLSAMQVHVGAALAAVPLLVWHTLARGGVRARRTDLSRRALLRAGAVAVGAGLAFLAVEGTTRLAALPGARRRFTGSLPMAAALADPARIPVTQWLDDRVEAVLDCTGGWYARAAWEGARLDRLLPAGALEGGGGTASLVVTSATGYRRRLPLADARTLLLATRLGGRPLSAGHGFPTRLVAPGRRGFWWVKWVTSIELDPAPWWRQPPFPLT